MIDWLKFFPFAWRYDKKPPEIHGPYFPALGPRKWFLQDSLIKFSAPVCNPVFGFSGRDRSVDACSPGTSNILKAEWERMNDTVPIYVWDRDLFYSKTWYFVGPWFSGFKAALKANALLITARDDEVFADKNLFHPRVFESAVANYLDASYGYEKNGSKPRYRGPLNWQVLPLSPSIQAVVFDMMRFYEAVKRIFHWQ